ncbi:MAG TPA: zinc ribbon domain-containing protein [Gammaproteobacteria bacterium]|nr:zinc ribbon domain-containing protein [Gammaproteobacteria bacterium]
MPIYEYQCQLCGHELEALQKVSDSPLTDCPKCGKPGLAKKISAAGFQLKGGGWYATDYKTPPKATTHESKTESENKKSDAKTETSPPTTEKKPPKDT